MEKVQYENSSQAIISLASKIANGKTTKRNVEKELKNIVKSFESPFLPTSFERKTKPWNKYYLKQLRGSVDFGKSSPEFMLYFAEVADYVYRPRRIIKATLIIAALVAIITIVTISNLHPNISSGHTNSGNTHSGGIV